MFNIVLLMGLFIRISAESSHNGSLDACNCTEWVPVNVTDLWGSCGVKYNTTRAWQCNEKSHERLLILFECTRLESLSNIIDSKDSQDTEEPTNRHNKPTYDFLLIFLYGAASGAGFLMLMILVLSTVICCLKKQRKNKPHCELIDGSDTPPIQRPDNVDSTASAEEAEEEEYIPVGLQDMPTQNESRHEVVLYENVGRNPDTLAENSGEILIPPPYTAEGESDDVTRDNDVDASPFGRGYEDRTKTSKASRPPYVNCNESRVYMHLILDTREKDDPTNLTTKPLETSKRAKMQISSNKKGTARQGAVTKKPTGPGTEARPSSAEYVNGYMEKLHKIFR